MAMDLERCCDLVEAEIGRLARVTDGADPATPVPTCPGWTLADLLRHTGEVYRWAATMVRDGAQERLRREQLAWDLPSEPGDLPAWIAAGADFAVPIFRACDPATPMWAWGWPKTAGFWPRRMVHEIGVHRADAQLALGLEPAFAPEVAADGIAELLDNLPHAASFAPGVSQLRGDGEAIGLVTTDAGTFRIELRPDGFTWSDTGAAAADVVVTGTAAALLLALYGRPATVEVDGDPELWARWRRDSAT